MVFENMNGIEGIDRAFKRISRISQNISRDAEKPLKASGVYMLGSIERNFKASGRPAKWKALSEKTLARRKKGKGRGGAKILIDTAQMKNSMAVKVKSTEAQIGTNAIQAKRHHFGYPGGQGRGRSKTPARPFVLIQDEDHDAIAEIFSRHVRRK